MSERLTVADFEILETCADLGDRYHYWRYLQNKGDPYAGLALGVVTNETLAGYTANTFLIAKGEAAGVAMTPQKLNEIGVGLMRADLQARKKAFKGDAKDGGLKLPVKVIETYHGAVFNELTKGRLDVTAWTAELPLRQAMARGDQSGDYAEAEGIFQDLMGNFPVLSALNIIGTPIDEELRWSETTGEAAAGFELGSVSEHSYRNTALIDGWTFEPKSGKWYKRFNRPPRIYYADESENKRLTEIRVLREEMFGNDVIPADQDPDVIDGWLYQRNQGLWSKTVLTPGSEGTPKTTVIHPDPKTVALLDQQRQTRMPDRAGAAPSPPAVAAPATTGAPPQAPRRAPPEASSPARRSEAPPSIPGGRLPQVAGSAGAESPGATGPVASPQTAVVALGAPMPDPGPLAAGLTAVGPEDPAGSGIGAELARSAAPAATRRWDQSWAALTDAGGTWPAGHPGPGELRSLPTSLESAMRLMPAWPEPASLEPAAFGPPSRPRLSEAAVEGSGPPPASPTKPPYEGLPVLWESPGLTVFDMSSVPMPKLGTQPEAYPGGSGAEPSVGGRWSDTTAETMTPDAVRRIAREVVLEALDAQARKPRAFSREELRIITRAVFDRMDELADRPATGRAGFDGRMSKQFVSTYNPRSLRW